MAEERFVWTMKCGYEQEFDFQRWEGTVAGVATIKEGFKHQIKGLKRRKDLCLCI